MPLAIILAAVSLTLMVASILLAPKPKAAKPPSATPQEDPTADAGREIPKIFGTMTIKDPNVLWFGDKSVKGYKVG